MIPLVDSRSGTILKVGDMVPHEKARIVSMRVGVFSADVVLLYGAGHEWAGQRQTVKSPVKWFPRATYGPSFPVGGLRIVMLPT